MFEGFKNIIAQLEKQKAAIERALAALRTVEGPTESASIPEAKKWVGAKGKSKLTPGGRKRLAEAMKRRWAAKRTAAQAKKRGK